MVFVRREMYFGEHMRYYFMDLGLRMEDEGILLEWSIMDLPVSYSDGYGAGIIMYSSDQDISSKGTDARHLTHGGP